jgi:hypothetical protein
VNDVQPNDAAAVGTAVRQLLADSLGYLPAAALRVVARFGVADHLAGGPRTAGELAEMTGVNAGHLARVLRFLASRGVFRQDETGAFHLTTAAAMLRSDSPLPLSPTVLLFTDDLYWRPAGKLDEAVQSGGTRLGEIFGEQFFDHLATNPDRARLFDDALATMSMTEQDAIAASYQFPETGTVVDIAGGLGGFLRAVLTVNLGLRGILFDQQPVLDRHRLDDPATKDRWETVRGDFFESVPADADFYVLKRIVHDKSERDALRILGSCRKAMTERSRLLIIDAVVPTGEDCPPSIALSDVLMLAVFEGKERTAAEYEELLAKAELKVNRIIPTPTSLSIVEAVVA